MHYIEFIERINRFANITFENFMSYDNQFSIAVYNILLDKLADAYFVITEYGGNFT